MPADEASMWDGWDTLVDALKHEGVTYLTGGTGWDAGGAFTAMPALATVRDPSDLMRSLASSNHARLRDALIALLLLHPEYADRARTLLTQQDLTQVQRAVLQSRLIAAACLQRLWWFSLSIYRTNQPRIPADVVEGSGLPSPDEDYGQPCMRALAARLRAEDPFPFSYEAEFGRVAELVLAELIAEANRAA